MNWMMIDMDSFFASVEQSLREELQDRPVGVIPVDTEHTCVIAASYDAKRMGVSVGTSVREARSLCPGIVLVKARPAIYVEMHHRILSSVDRCAPFDRVYSIDEWTIRLRGEDRRPEQAFKLARRLKRQILDDFGPWLTCSIGIASSRLLAKIACGLGKPNGLTGLPVSDMPGRLEHLPLKGLCGISDGMLARLSRHGIENVRQLWDVSQKEAVQIWGSVSGARWWAGFHGIDEPEVPTRRRSMSHAHVLHPRFRNEEGARCILIRLTCKLAQRLRRNGYVARSMSISISGERGGSWGGKIGLLGVNDTPTLLHQFHKLWGQRLPSIAPIKKVGVCVSELTLGSQVPPSLFDEIKQDHRLSETLDQINRRWGPEAIYVGSVLHYGQPMENKIAFGRIPEPYD